MLIRFSFKNFKSFKDENCLDMEATSLKEHEYNVAKIDNGEYLKVSAIYGANASGKTNVLQAFDYMKKRILVSDDSKKNSPIDEENVYSFMINNDPIALEVEILARNNKIYKYGFELVKDNIRTDQKIYLVPCFGLANAIERKDKKEIKTLLKEIFKDYKDKNIDSIVLGCTHYPLFKTLMQKELSECEEDVLELWKNFYKTIAIKERTNERCRMNFMPKKYWKYIIEMSDEIEKNS